MYFLSMLERQCGSWDRSLNWDILVEFMDSVSESAAAVLSDCKASNFISLSPPMLPLRCLFRMSAY